MAHRLSGASVSFLVQALVLACMPLPPSRSACWAEVQGDLELLDQIRVAHVSNREKLATWEGEADVHTFTKGPSKLWDRTVHVKFAYQREPEAWVFHWIYVKTEDERFDGTQVGGMYLDHAWYSYDPYLSGSSTIQGVLIRPGPARKIGPMTAAFGPMYYFKVRENDLDSQIDIWLDNAGSDWLKLMIHREGALVTVNSANVNIPTASSCYVFDLSKGGNAVSVVGDDDIRQVRRSSDWEQRGGVWVPSRATYENKTHDGTKVARKTVDWQRSVVNEPLGKDTFSLDTMHVVAGASIQDDRVGKRWRYKEAELKEHEKEEAPSPPADRRARALVAVTSSVVLFILVVGLFVWRRTIPSR